LRRAFHPGRILSTSIFSNFLWSVLNLGLSKGLRLVGIMLCVRQMGTEPWGQVASTAAMLALIGLLVSQGLGGLPQIFRVNDREMDRPLLFNICLYRLVMAAVVILSLHVLRPFVPAINPLVLAYSFVLIPRALNFEWLFHRRERYHFAVAINTVKAVAFFALVAWNIGPESTAQAVILVEIISEACGLLFSLAFLKRAGLAGSPAGGGLALRVLLTAALPVFLSEALHTLPSTVDILFLKSLWGYQTVAEYDVGARIGMAYFFLGAALVQIVIPKLSRLYAAGEVAQMGRVLSVASGLLLVLGSLLLLPSFYYASESVRFLFDKDYASTVFVFRWMPVWVYISFMTMLNTIVLLAVGRRRQYFYGALLSTAVNVTANWLLITHYAVAGAVFARILGEVAFCIYAAVLLPRGVMGSYKGELLTQTGLLATLILIFAGTGRFPGIVGFTLSALVCGAVFWRRGIFSRETLRILREH
jgi:O-antigen/teichoic acid export membrane protein